MIKISHFPHSNACEYTFSQTYEYRVPFELRVRFNSEIESKVGAIEKVKIEGAAFNSAVPLNFDVEGD